MDYADKISTKQRDTFFHNISEPNDQGCCLWLSKVDSKGAPVYTIKVDGKVRYITCSRLAYYFYKGSLPGGIVRHTCDNTICLTNSHLIDGYNWDNARDTVERDRSLRGEGNPSAKLTEDQVREIKRRSRIDSMTKLVREFGVSYATIRSIRKGFTWAHVE